MSKNEARVKKAMDIALEQLDYIMDYYTTPDFVEVTGRMGGDVITYRIYDDGSIYERQKNNQQIGGIVVARFDYNKEKFENVF